LHDEFLISIFRPDELQPATPLYVSQPTLGIAPVEDDPGEPETEGEVVGLQPFSFTFDFTSAPDPLNVGGDGDDWLYLQYDGTGYFNVVEGVPAIIPPAYNQTVGGRDGVAKWTMLDGSSLPVIFFTSGSPQSVEGDINQMFGRINSWPENWLDYSTYRLSFDAYFSNVLDSSSSNVRIYLSGLTFSPDGYTGTSELSDYPIAQDQWLSFDTGELAMGVNGNAWMVMRFIMKESFADGGFVALDNVTLTMTP